MIGIYTVVCLNADNKELLGEETCFFQWQVNRKIKYIQSTYNMGVNVYFFGVLVKHISHPLYEVLP